MSLVHPFRSSLSTYRELCSMATDLNQPDLIYKFMHLANHNALWNSRKVSFVLYVLYACFFTLLLLLTFSNSQEKYLFTFFLINPVVYRWKPVQVNIELNIIVFFSQVKLLNYFSESCWIVCVDASWIVC